MCEEKMFQLQFMPHAVKCVDQRFAGKNFGHCVSSLTLILDFSNKILLDFSNKKIKILHAKKLIRVCIVFFSMARRFWVLLSRQTAG